MWRRCERLVRLMRKFDLSEVSLQDGEKKVRLRRGAKVVAAAPIATAPAPTVGTAPAPTPAAAPASSSKFIEIKSPMVGTFYAKPSPDKDDYVKVGTRVNRKRSSAKSKP